MIQALAAKNVAGQASYSFYMPHAYNPSMRHMHTTHAYRPCTQLVHSLRNRFCGCRSLLSVLPTAKTTRTPARDTFFSTSYDIADAAVVQIRDWVRKVTCTHRGAHALSCDRRQIDLPEICSRVESSPSQILIGSY